MTFTRTARAAAAAVLLGLLVAACGDDDDSSDEPAEDAASCVDRFVEFANSDEVVEAAEAGDELDSDLEDEFEDIEDDCTDAFENLTAAEAQDMLSRLDPAVLEMIGGPSEGFEETEDSISDAG
jgi:Skp family chaperone for outer membrane proteins